MPRGNGTLREVTLKRIEPLSGLLLLPVYFVLAGLKVDLSDLDTSDLGPRTSAPCWPSSWWR